MRLPENRPPRFGTIMLLQTARGASPKAGAPDSETNPARRRSARAALELAFGLGVLLERIALGVDLVVDRLRISRRRIGLGGLVLRHALLEGLDALREVA